MSAHVLGAAFLGIAGLLLNGVAYAAGTIYLSTTQGGLPSYSSEPTGGPATLYLTVGDPPPRPRQRRIDLTELGRTAARSRFDAQGADATLEGMAREAARAYAIPHALLMAVMHAESNFNPQARSPVGAVGLMQVMPPTGRRYGVHKGLADPATNIDVGARYLKDLLAFFQGDERLALAAYNSGEGAVMKYGRRIPPYAETQAYVPRVMGLYAQYRKRLG
jgi:Transglycosylase SLT domain